MVDNTQKQFIMDLHILLIFFHLVILGGYHLVCYEVFIDKWSAVMWYLRERWSSAQHWSPAFN